MEPGAAKRRASMDDDDEAKRRREEEGEDAEEYPGRVGLLCLSDDVLLCVLQHCAPRDLKALGFSCRRLGRLVRDRSLWCRVDARGRGVGGAQLLWYLRHSLGAYTTSLALAGFADEAKGCLGTVECKRPIIPSPIHLTDLKLSAETNQSRSASQSQATAEAGGSRSEAPSSSRRDVGESSNDVAKPAGEGLNGDRADEPMPLDGAGDGRRGGGAEDGEGQAEAPEAPREPPVACRRPCFHFRRRTHSRQLPRFSGGPAWHAGGGGADAAGACAGPRWTLARGSLAELRAVCPRLTELRLEQCNIDCNVTQIADFPRTLRLLSLRGTRCYNLEVNKSYLFRIHDYMPDLEEVDVGECSWMEPATLLPLSKLTQLRTLRAERCRRLTECVAYASLAARYGFRKLKVLDLRGTPMGDSEVSGFGWLPELEELYLEPSEARAPAEHHSHYLDDARAPLPELEPWEEEEPDYFSFEGKPLAEAENSEPVKRKLQCSNCGGNQDEQIYGPTAEPVVNFGQGGPPGVQRSPAFLNWYDEIRRESETRANQAGASRDPDEPPAKRARRSESKEADDDSSSSDQSMEKSADNGLSKPSKRQDSEKDDTPKSSDGKQEPKRGVNLSNCTLLRQMIASRSEADGGPSTSSSDEPGNADVQGTPETKRDPKLSLLRQMIASRPEVDGRPSSSSDVPPSADVPKPPEGTPESKREPKLSNCTMLRRLIASPSDTDGPSTSRPAEDSPPSNSGPSASTRSKRPLDKSNSPATNEGEPAAQNRNSPSNPRLMNLAEERRLADERIAEYQRIAIERPLNFDIRPEEREEAYVDGDPHGDRGELLRRIEQMVGRERANEEMNGIDEIDDYFGQGRVHVIYVNVRRPRHDVFRMLVQEEVQRGAPVDGGPPNAEPPGNGEGPREGDALRNGPNFAIMPEFNRLGPNNRGQVMNILRMPFIQNFLYAPAAGVAHLGGQSLITDAAINRFGHSEGPDMVNYVHIGPNGAVRAGMPPANGSDRPNKSRLKILVCRGFSGITNRSLNHLVTAAPALRLLDVTDTKVTEQDVVAFKNLRPECEVKFTPKKE